MLKKKLQQFRKTSNKFFSKKVLKISFMDCNFCTRKLEKKISKKKEKSWYSLLFEKVK